MKLETEEETQISKKLAAREVFKAEKKALHLAALSVGSILVIAVVMAVYKNAATIIAGLVACFYGYMVVVSRNKLVYLDQRYGLGEYDRKR